MNDSGDEKSGLLVLSLVFQAGRDTNPFLDALSPLSLLMGKSNVLGSPWRSKIPPNKEKNPK